MTKRREHPFGRPLPAGLAEIADAAGLDAAMKLAEARGGAFLHVARDGDLLPGLVGAEAAAAIARKLGAGNKIYVPVADYHLVKWLQSKSVSRAEIVRRTRVPIRTQQRWDAPPGEADQLSLKLGG
ncbi:MAG: hypothetical protein NBV67_00870 [Tagaea sp.]|nr:hypothetical protein [Tagaea sp.]